MTNHVLLPLLQASWQAGVLVIVVASIQALCGNRLAPRWRHALWMLVLLRLVLPSTVEFRWSLFTRIPSLLGNRLPLEERGISKTEPAPIFPAVASTSLSLAETQVREAAEVKRQDPPAVTAAPGAQGSPEYSNPNVPSGRGGRVPAWDWLGVGWLAGVGALTLCMVLPSLRFRHRVSKLSPIPDPELLELLNSCRRLLGVRCRLLVYETDLISSPALFGLLSPRLLLPPGIRCRFSRRQLEHIFLHELAHLKRGDLLINWAMTALWVLHWFNPLVWFAVSRIRVERELACDAMALAHLEAQEAKSYGETIIRLVEDFSNRGAVPGLLGMREDRGALRRRIAMIAQFRRPGRWSVLGGVVVAAVGLVSLTDAQVSPKPVSENNAGIIVLPDDLPTTDPQPMSDPSGAWRIVGRVLDASTLQPLPRFRVTVGEFPDLKWEDSKTIQDAQGRFALLVSRDTRHPGVRVEAEGYLLGGGAILPGNHPQLDIKLTKGDGPRGRVLLPDGNPAAQMRVALVPQGFDLGAAEDSGWRDSHPDRYWTKFTDGDGRFDFWPSWKLTQVLVSSKAGWALVSAEQLISLPLVHLQPFARLRGTLRREAQPISNAELFVRPGSCDSINVRLPRAFTDPLGRFEFETLPPGNIRIELREREGSPNLFGLQPMIPLAEMVVQPGGDVVADFDVPNLKLIQPPNHSRQLDPVRVPGAGFTGIVLAPSGIPAAGVEVAVTLPERPVTLGRGQLGDFPFEPGQTTRTDAAGRFRLSGFEGAGHLIAVNETGIAQCTVGAFRASPTLRLEPWAEIRGTFRVGSHAIRNATLRPSLEAESTFERESLLSAFPDYSLWAQTATRPLIRLESRHTFLSDDQGRYRMLYVPPGLVGVRREVNIRPGNDWTVDLARVKAEAGKITQLDVGGRERRIRGKLVFPGERPLLLRQSFSGFLESEELLRFRKRLESLSSPGERTRLAGSQETTEVLARSRILMVPVSLDSTIYSDLVLPGKYGVRIDSRLGLLGLCWSVDSAPPPFVSRVTFEIPEAKPGQEDQVVDLGNIELDKIQYPR